MSAACRGLLERWQVDRNTLLDTTFPPITMSLQGVFTMFDGGFAATLQLRYCGTATGKNQRDNDLHQVYAGCQQAHTVHVQTQQHPNTHTPQAMALDALYEAATPASLTYSSFFVNDRTVRVNFPSGLFDPTTRTLFSTLYGVPIHVYTGRLGFLCEMVLVPHVCSGVFSMQPFVAGLTPLEGGDEGR